MLPPDWINVQDTLYGALGNGSYDDTDAIEDALAAAESGAAGVRNAVYFPPGNYRITRTLEIERSLGTRLIGVGNVPGLPINIGGYNGRQTGAVLFWDGEPGLPLLRFYGTNFGTLENLAFVGATPQRYKFSTTTTDSDPGDGKLRFNNASFASVTQIFADDMNDFGWTITNWLDRADYISAGRITIEVTAGDNAGAFRIFDVDGSVTSGSGYRKIPVKYVQSSGAFANNDVIVVSYVRSGGTPQPYRFSVSTDPNPGDELLRFNNSTFASITKIYVGAETANHEDAQAWLDSIDDRPDVRVTVQKFDNPAIIRIFKVISVEGTGANRTINVTPIHSAGTISDNDSVALSCSTVTPIRDRAGALLAQHSLEGWPAGHLIIHNCTFREADDGLRLDETTPTNNCADNVIVQCSFIACAAGIKVNSSQVVNNAIVNCDFNECAIGIDHELGGDIRVFGASMNGYVGGVFLKIRGGGNNTSSFVLYGVRLEMKAGKPSLIETTAAAEADILIDGFGWTGGSYPDGYAGATTYGLGAQTRVDNTLYESLAAANVGNSPATSPASWRWLGEWVRPVRLGQLSNCTVRGAIVKGPFASVNGGASKATLRLDNCRMSYGASDAITTDSTGYWKQVDCTDGSGLPIADAGNWPIALAQTWNSSGTTFTAMKLDVTDTASASGSLLMDLRVGGSSKVKADKSGKLYAQSLDLGGGSLTVDNDGNIAMSGGGAILDVNTGVIVGVYQLTTNDLFVSNLSVTGTVTSNRILAAPDGSNGAPIFRAVVVGDLPVAARTIQISRSTGAVRGTSSLLLPPIPGVSATITAARLVVAAGIAASDTNYWSFQIINKGTNGSGTTPVLAASNANTTKATGGINSGGGLTAYALAVLTLHGTTSNRNVTAGQTLLIEFTKTGTPGALEDSVVEVDLEVTG